MDALDRRWRFPVDPDCQEVAQHHEAVMEDPMTQHYGIGDEILEDFERRHRQTCKHCQEYGAANVAVE